MTRVIDCENIMCLYQEEGTCTKQEINLNCDGRCTDYIRIVINEVIIEEKKRYLQSIIGED